MLKINLIDDQELRYTVNCFISSLLPHQSYNPGFFTTNLCLLLKYVHLEEFQMEHRLLLEVLTDLNRIKTSLHEYSPYLTRETFERILEASIMDAVLRPELGVVEWLSYEGLNTDLNIPTVREDTCQRVCERALNLYDECMELEEPSNDLANHEPELRAAFMSHVGVQCINMQSEIMRHEARVGRKRYRGFDDWLKYTRQMTAEINERLSSADNEKIVRLDSVEGSYKLLSEVQKLLIPITNYGIPELDCYTPILRHRLVVVVGKENIGKTKFVVDQTVNVLISGGSVVYMCGETEKAKVFASIMINYVYKVYGIIIRNEHLAAPEVCPDDVRKVIGMSIDTVITKGGLTLCDAFDYATVGDELEKLYETSPYDMVVIDHSCALIGKVGDGSEKDKVSELAKQCRDFKKAYPVCVMVASHPSASAKETAKADKATVDSTTRGSQNLSIDADDVLYLRDNETLSKQGLIMLENTKRRDAGRVQTPIILQKKFEVSAFIYDPALQSANAHMTLDREAALNELDKQLRTEDDDIFNLEE